MHNVSLEIMKIDDGRSWESFSLLVLNPIMVKLSNLKKKISRIFKEFLEASERILRTEDNFQNF